MLFTIAETIAARCYAHPKRPALDLLGANRTVTYDEVWQRMTALSRLLKTAPAGRHGTLVGVILPNGLDAALILAAAQLAGVTAVAINGRLTVPEMKQIVQHSDCRMIVSDGELFDLAALVANELNIGVRRSSDVGTPEVAPRVSLGDRNAGEEPCVIAYSSGTTGMPKGAIYSNDYFVMNNYRWGWEFGLTSEHVILITGPMFHLSYAGFALAGLSIGARIRVMDEFSAEQTYEELSSAATFAFLVPSMLAMLQSEWESRGREPMRAARHVISAGAPLPVELAKTAMQMFLSARVAEMYGSTECGFVTYEVKTAKTLLPHSVGWPAVSADVALFNSDGNRCAVGEAGEVGVKGPVAFSGFLDDQELNEKAWQDGYLMSGDIGIWQSDGRLCIVDRKNDMIISGGENVYTAEVERVMVEHPDINEAAVVGVPDTQWGERVAAVYITATGVDVSSTDVQDHCRQSLAGYKIPRLLKQVYEIPRNAMGKVQKFKVVELLN